MKKKLDKATRKKIILAVVIIAGLICGYKIIDAASYQFVKTKAEIYLCIKYDAKPSEIELVDYKHSGIYWDEYKVFLIIPKWTDFSFEFKYNDRNFIVNREKGRFYDDYQLDEIEKWCTDWLKENVDERIVGIELESDNILAYQNNTHKSHFYLLKEKDAEDFLNNYLFNTEKHFGWILYFDKSLLNERFTTETDNEIALKLKEKTTIGEKLFVNYTKSYMYKYSVKTVYYKWITYYTTYQIYKNVS